jgi:hypothetical protein
MIWTTLRQNPTLLPFPLPTVQAIAGLLLVFMDSHRLLTIHSSLFYLFILYILVIPLSLIILASSITACPNIITSFRKSGIRFFCLVHDVHNRRFSSPRHGRRSRFPSKRWDPFVCFGNEKKPREQNTPLVSSHAPLGGCSQCCRREKPHLPIDKTLLTDSKNIIRAYRRRQMCL